MALNIPQGGGDQSSSNKEEAHQRLEALAVLLSCALHVREEDGTYHLLGGRNNNNHHHHHHHQNNASDNKRLVDMMMMMTTMTTTTTTHGDCSSCCCCTIPSLQLHQPHNNNNNNNSNNTQQHEQQHLSSNTNNLKASSKPVLQKAAASNLQVPIHLQGPSNVERAPMTLLWNLQDSLFYLISSRLKSTVQALGGKGGTSPNSNNPRSKIVLEVLQPAGNPIRLSTMVTSVQAIPVAVAETVAGCCCNDDDDDTNNNTNATTTRQPVLFQAVVDYKVLGQIVTVQVQAPGTLQGTHVSNNNNNNNNDDDDESQRFATVQLVLDTTVLLQSLMQETRRLVRRAVSLATQVAACVTQTLPRNAPIDLQQQHGQLLRSNTHGNDNDNQTGGGVPPVALLSHALQEEAQDAQCSYQNNNNNITHKPLLHLPQPMDSTKALEECFTMPPPPARLPRAGSCPNAASLAALEASGANSRNGFTVKRPRSGEEDGEEDAALPSTKVPRRQD